MSNHQLRRGEKSCPEDGPHDWGYDALIKQMVCRHCGILELWLLNKQRCEREEKTARRLLDFTA
jgi:hypothetical protein